MCSSDLAPIAGMPDAPGEARALASSGASLFVGGRFSALGGQPRRDLVAVRISTGEVLPWAPDATRLGCEFIFGQQFCHDSNLTALAADASNVYIAMRFFASIGYLVEVRALARATGALVWANDLNGTVNALAVADTVLYVGGHSDTPGRNVIPLRIANGAEIPWGAPVDGETFALQVTPQGLAVGGQFTSLGGQPRNNLAMLDFATGLATGWNPGADAPVRSLAFAGNTLFCGGDFANLGGQPRSRLASVALDTGTPDAWNPCANATVRSLVFDQGVLFAGGDFTTIGGQPRSSLAAVNPATGSVLPLDAGIGSGQRVNSVASAGGHVFAAGTQTTASAEPTLGLTVVTAPDPTLDVDGPGTRGDRPALLVTPQPARGAAQVRLRLPRAADAELGVYDLAGRRIELLSPRALRPAGEHTFELAPRRLEPGLYLVRASTTDGNVTAKLVVLP